MYFLKKKNRDKQRYKNKFFFDTTLELIFILQKSDIQVE